MSARTWWLRLLLWQSGNALRVQPVRRSLTLLVWFVPALALPTAWSLAGPASADAALDWLLSFDVPMGLLLAAQVGTSIVALATRADAESWVLPQASRGWAGRWLLLARLVGAMRWSMGVVLAALLLYAGSSGAPEPLAELLVIVLFALVGGASLAWMLLGGRRSSKSPARVSMSHRRGWAALSWVPLAETLRRLDPRRIALLAVPVLAGAPMATEAQVVLRWLAAWVVMIYLATGIQQAASTAAAMHAWMPRMAVGRGRLFWYVWRYIALAALVGLAGLWLGWRATSTAVVPVRQ